MNIIRFSLIWVLLFGCLCSLVAESGENPGFWYTISWGETISTIAARYSVNPHLLAGVNNITDWDYIRAGEKLWIPLEKKEKARTYIVQQDDYLLKIAGAVGVSVWALAKANGIFNLDAICPGQVLIIPSE